MQQVLQKLRKDQGPECSHKFVLIKTQFEILKEMIIRIYIGLTSFS